MTSLDARRVDPFVARPDRAGVLTDFDGTLAPIVADPTMSRPLPAAVDGAGPGGVGRAVGW